MALSGLSLSACKSDADLSDAAPKPVILNADEYRQEITEIDRLVFGEQPLGDARRESLATKLEGLARRVNASSDSRSVEIEAMEMQRFASGTRSLPSNAPPTALQREWMRIRHNLFDDRSWFARSAADLEAPSPDVNRRSP